MKKWIYILSSCLLLSGCNKSVAENKKGYYFVFATPLSEHPVWKQAELGFKNACAELEIHCDSMGPSVISIESMTSVIETAATQKADAIITQGVISPSLINRVQEYDIPMVLIDSDVPNSKRIAYLGKDFTKQAQMLLEHIEGQYTDSRKLRIAIQVAELNFDIAKEQIEEVKKAFKNYPGEVEIVSISESKSDRLRANHEWSRVLSEEKDINVALNFAGESAGECASIAENLGIRNQLLIYGVDDMEETLQMIIDERIDGSVVTSFYNYGYQSVKWLYEYKETGVLPEPKSARMMIVQKNNINDYKRILDNAEISK